MRFLDNLRYRICCDRLRRRRKVVVRTLNYLDAERKIVDTNGQWENPWVQRNRMWLLDKIHRWYDKELKKIDTVLGRLSQP